MTVEKVRELGVEFERGLKLKTKPMGLNFFEKVEDVPKEYQWVNRKKAICNIIGFARFYEIAVVITAENLSKLCVVSDLSLGIGKVPEQFPANAVGAFAKNINETSKMLVGMKSLDYGKYKAFGVCPLEFATVIPDVVQIWANPTQILELEYSNTWNHGDGKIELSTNGHGASCYEASTKPYIDHKLCLAIADSGDKRHGMAADDDMILGVPTDLLEELYEGLVATNYTRNRLPILYNFDDINFPIPETVLGHSPILRDLKSRKTQS